MTHLTLSWRRVQGGGGVKSFIPSRKFRQTTPHGTLAEVEALLNTSPQAVWWLVMGPYDDKFVYGGWPVMRREGKWGNGPFQAINPSRTRQTWPTGETFFPWNKFSFSLVGYSFGRAACVYGEVAVVVTPLGVTDHEEEEK